MYHTQVLIADDLKMNRTLLRAALSRHCCSEWQITDVSSAETAITELCVTTTARPDLVLMDDHFEVGLRSLIAVALRASSAP